MNFKLHLPKRLWLLQVTFLIVITARQLKQQQQNLVNVTELKYFTMMC